MTTTLNKNIVAFLRDREPTYTNLEIMLTGRIDPVTGELDPNTMNGLPTGYMWVHGEGSRAATRAVMTVVMRQFALAAGKRVRTGINQAGERVAIEPVADGQSAPTADQLLQEAMKSAPTPYDMVTGGRVQFATNGGLNIYVGEYLPMGWAGGNLAIDAGDLPAVAGEFAWVVPYFTGVYGDAPLYDVTTPAARANVDAFVASNIADAFSLALPAGAIRLAGVTVSEGQTDITAATSRLKDLRHPIEPGGVQTIVPGANISVDDTDPANPIVAAVAISGTTGDTITLEDQKAATTDGGTFTSGAWRTRDLNTIVNNVGSHASLASNQVTLAAGTYRLTASAPAFDCDEHQVRWYNITDTAEVFPGTAEYANATNSLASRSFVGGEFTIAASKVFELQHQCRVTKATNGMGVGNTFGSVMVYSTVELIKIA